MLHRHVDRGEHAQPALIHALPAEAVDQLLPDLFLEVLAVRLLGAQTVVEHRPCWRARTA